MGRIDELPDPVFEAIGRLERAAATHDAEGIGRALQDLVDHYGADVDTPVAFADPDRAAWGTGYQLDATTGTARARSSLPRRF